MTTAIDPRTLPDDVDALKALLIAELAKRDARILQLEHENRLLRKEAFAPKSERRPQSGVAASPGQMHLLFPELIEAAERVADVKQVQGHVEIRKAATAGTPRRRKRFPPHLPVMRSTFELPPEQRRCSCGHELSEIGEDVTKELERLDISVVHEIARKKYACKGCEVGVRIAPGPNRVIDRGLLGVGFLAHVIIERFAHHMPYNRLEAKYASEGFELSRSVLSASALRCAELLAPIATQIQRDAKALGVVQTDSTSVTIQEGSDRNSRQGNVWVYRGLGGQVFYDMTESRSRDGPRAVLEGFEGYLQADAHVVYDSFFKDGRVLEVGCWAHARRYYIKAEDAEPNLAKEVIARIRELYAIERRAKEAALTPSALRELRQAESLPRLVRLREWLGVARTQVLDRGAMAKAIDYSLAHWSALVRYCEDGRLDIDNNAAERALRTVAVGRKNWIFFGNERGGEAAAVLYSLIATCREHGVDPRSYLRDVLLRIGTESDVGTLTPYGWKARWQPIVDEHRASIFERLASRAGN